VLRKGAIVTVSLSLCVANISGFRHRESFFRSMGHKIGGHNESASNTIFCDIKQLIGVKSH